MPAQPNQFTLGLVQMSCGPDPEANLEKAVERIRQAAAGGAQIICLQELFRSLYFCQREDPDLFDLAEPIPGPSTEQLSRVARETGTVVVASLFERRTAGVYHNTAAVLDADGALLGLYRKMHVPGGPPCDEAGAFAPGDLGFRAFDTRFGRIGVLVCWDQWYPEGARLTALQGAQVLLYPTAIGWHPREQAEFGTAQYQAWELIQRSHAVANGVYVAAVNRVGHEEGAGEGLNFWGGSFVCDPFGGVLRRASQEAEEVLVVPCDLRRLEETRRHWPFLRDRRIDAYGDITRRVLD
ncbi:MAG: carbon-nitrogen hydrolase [Planctomycetes bacterium]|nr:carbon-nitrogen hydrolase [Planctomycetota bacterium]